MSSPISRPLFPAFVMPNVNRNQGQHSAPKDQPSFAGNTDPYFFYKDKKQKVNLRPVSSLISDGFEKRRPIRFGTTDEVDKSLRRLLQKRVAQNPNLYPTEELEQVFNSDDLYEMAKNMFLTNVQDDPDYKMSAILNRLGISNSSKRNSLISWASKHRNANKVQAYKEYDAIRKESDKEKWEKISPHLPQAVKADINSILSKSERLARLRDKHPQAVAQLPDDLQDLLPPPTSRKPKEVER
jgi:hypothetical protein